MSTPFIGQLMCCAFNFPPKGWSLCAGQLMAINQSQALFSLLGTTFGGNGMTTFGLPDLRGRTPIHVGPNFNLGLRGGEESHTINQTELPQHTHLMSGTTNQANKQDGNGNLLGKTTNNLTVYAGQPDTILNAATIPAVGGSQAHENRSPFLALNWCISLQGIFPSQN
jgi:microcystin-dependent protein